VHTLGAEAVDVFYVQAANGSPLTPARSREIASEVAQALT
jgi:UTP:GlnB (protein PII) uridylyltransferase